MGWRIDQPKNVVYIIDDVHRYGHCFTDGVGKISFGLAREVALSMGINVKRDVRMLCKHAYHTTRKRSI